MTKDDFIQWLRERIRISGLTQSEIAARAGISEAQLSRVLSRERNPGIDFCVGIARALNVPPENVFAEAGIFRYRSKESKNFKEAEHLFSQLSDRQQNDVLTMMRALVEERRRGSSPHSQTA